MFNCFNAIPSYSHVITNPYQPGRKLVPRRPLCEFVFLWDFDKAIFNVKQAMLATLACMRVSADV